MLIRSLSQPAARTAGADVSVRSAITAEIAFLVGIGSRGATAADGGGR